MIEEELMMMVGMTVTGCGHLLRCLADWLTDLSG